MTIYRKKIKNPCLAIVFCVFGIGIIAAPHQTNAQVGAAEIAETPCDEVYFDSLEARAWLEAQREITQNQNLIFKADSVLEYTCFDKFANVLAQFAVDMFSENAERWGEILPDNSMDVALDLLVGEALIDYISLNFGHDFLGGRLEGENYEPSSISGGEYGCTVMNDVWLKAKCMNFIENEDEDGFYTFEQYSTDPDKRFLPERCDPGEERWDDMIDTALELPPWEEDPIWTHLDRLDNFRCGSEPPIPTGITVRRPVKEPLEYQEHICLQIGCTYDPAGGCG
ncbi:MAG: hypothetical protein DHS20C02_02690 [Micavibrio sp.]|nr:MAG: hypothetical protein DHS20C02_02690 [Micavibrio sp.]